MLFGSMPVYRAYHLKEDRHIAGPPTMFASPDDTDAIKEARKLIDGHDIELWEGSRFVIGLSSKDG
jgi:hypothetical protein